MAPSTTKQWTVEGKNGFDSLKFHEKADIPALGDHDVLVNFHYASLNYRDLIIPKVTRHTSHLLSLTSLSSIFSSGQISLSHCSPNCPSIRRRRHRRRYRSTRFPLPKGRSSPHTLQPIPSCRLHHSGGHAHRRWRHGQWRSSPIRHF